MSRHSSKNRCTTITYTDGSALQDHLRGICKDKIRVSQSRWHWKDNILWRLSKICPNIKKKQLLQCLLPCFFYQAGFTSIIGKSNMYTDVVATVGVCGFLWHCLAPLASQLLLHPRQQKWKKGKQAETGFSIKNHSKISSNFGGDKLIHKRLEWCFFCFFPFESVDQFQSFRAQVIEIPGGLLAGQYFGSSSTAA